MRKAAVLILTFTVALLSFSGCAQLPVTSNEGAAAQFLPYTPEQLDNLLAPIALYPDPLLAQVLIAATFPDQIDEAARWVRSYGDSGVDDQPWDGSVRSVAHYATVLYMMDDDLDWTTAVGQAYAYQSTDVMASIQRLRAMARAQGNLVTTPQQEVIVEGGFISIWPASATSIYVPVYDPSIVFFQPVYYDGGFTAFSFGAAMTIGVWLNLDCDWHHHRVYYTGWHGRGWIERSRPHVHLSPRYVAPHFSTIVVNRRVSQRPVNFTDLSRYHGIHRRVTFENRARGTRSKVRPEMRVPNKVIDRNIPSNQRLAPFRGRERVPPVPQPARPAPKRQPGAVPGPAQPRPAPSPSMRRQAPVQPLPAARPPNAFGRGDSLFDPRAAGRRGRQSREEMRRRPAASSGPADQHRPSGSGRLARPANGQPAAKPGARDRQHQQRREKE